MFSKILRYHALALVLLISSATSINAQLITTIAGSAGAGYNGDGGPATAAELGNPIGVKTDASGNIYIADRSNQRIRKVNSSGTISTLAGYGIAGIGGDGGPATAAFLNYPNNIAVSGDTLYIPDNDNNVIRAVNLTTGIITHVSGFGLPGFSGDGSSAYSNVPYYRNPEDMTVDPVTRNIYIVDESNYRIRKIDGTTGILSTFASSSLPLSVTTDALGNVYFTDNLNMVVYKANIAGTVTIFAGTYGVESTTGDGGPATAATFNSPWGITADAAGNVYVAENLGNVIRKINTAGIISTIAGTAGIPGFSGDGGPATAAQFDNIANITVDNMRHLLVADEYNNRIRRIDLFASYPYFISGPGHALTVCENSTGNSINTLVKAFDTSSGLTDTWSMAIAPHHGTVTTTYSIIAAGGIMTPTGTSYTPTMGYNGTDTFQVRVTNGITADTIAIYVTINPAPALGAINGLSAVCVGSVITLTDTAAGGTWSSSSPGTATVSSGHVTGVLAGTDVITYAASIGSCSTTVTKTITVNPLPVAGTITGDTIVCAASNITISDAVTGGTWLASNSNATVSGGTVTGVTAGMDIILYLVSNSCGTDTASYHITILTADSCNALNVTGTLNGSKKISIAPNPADDEVTVTIAAGVYDLLNISNTAGQIVITQKLEASQNRISLTSVPPGLYYITLSGKDGRVTEKLLKQ